MPTYDFKCEECELIKEATMPFKESEEGITCDCGGTMIRQFTPCDAIICTWNIPYKPGTNAKKDRKRAFKGLEEQGKLPKEIKGDR